MKYFVNLIHFALISIALWGCNANDSFFTQKIENDPGKLSILNESGFIGAYRDWETSQIGRAHV